jgi:putative intracellular protease/amidase
MQSRGLGDTFASPCRAGLAAGGRCDDREPTSHRRLAHHSEPSGWVAAICGSPFLFLAIPANRQAEVPLSRDRGLRTLCCVGHKAQSRIQGFRLFHSHAVRESMFLNASYKGACYTACLLEEEEATPLAMVSLQHTQCYDCLETTDT